MKLCKLGFVVCVFILLGVFPSIGNSQIVYSPDHPEVKALADGAVEYLKNSRNQTMPHRALSALAIVEHAKRYQGRVPKDDPFVKGVVEQLAGSVEAIIDEEEEIYYSCVVTILLAETDAKAYKSQINTLLDNLKSRQEANGSFTYRKDKGRSSDTSQTQFAALAMFVAKHHGFEVDLDMAKRTLEWMLGSQQGNGSWVYKFDVNGSANDYGRPRSGLGPTLSMQAAGIGTVYLLADLLNLNKRAKSMSKSLSGKDSGLPRTVSIYVEPVAGQNATINKKGPLVSFDRGKLGSGSRAGNQRLESVFKVQTFRWPIYYLYAMERYTYFREQAEGNVGNGALKDWYDQSVEMFKTLRQDNGSFRGSAGEPENLASAFGVLVLVRSSEVITSIPATAKLNGTVGFKKDAVLLVDKKGRIKSVSAEKDLGEFLEMMKEGASTEQMQQLMESLKKQIGEFRQKDDKSRGEIKAFLQSMVSARDYFRRLIAVRFLAGEQDMDNVPALLYALGDPDLRICLEAHDGLRLVSRKIDSMSISKLTRKNATRDPGVLKPQEDNDCRIEFDDMKVKWTEWFLKIRPGAELLD